MITQINFADMDAETVFTVMETETMRDLTKAYWGHGIEGTLVYQFIMPLPATRSWNINQWGDEYIAYLRSGPRNIDRICKFTADQWAEALASINPPMSRTEELEIENASLKRQLETLKQVNAELGAHNAALLASADGKAAFVSPSPLTAAEQAWYDTWAGLQKARAVHLTAYREWEMNTWAPDVKEKLSAEWKARDAVKDLEIALTLASDALAKEMRTRTGDAS